MNRNVNMGVYTKNGEEHTFNYYTTLRAVDKLKFVNNVTDLLVGDNYNSVIRDMIFDYTIIDIMTDIDTSEINNSISPISEIEDLLDETNIVEIVKANAEGLIEELNDAVDENIAYRTGIHKNPIAESLGNLFNTIEKKLSGFDTEKIMEMAQVISSMAGELTAEKAVDAYLNSDLRKQQQAELLASKSKSNSETKVIKKTTKTTSKPKSNDKIVPMK